MKQQYKPCRIQEEYYLIFIIGFVIAFPLIAIFKTGIFGSFLIGVGSFVIGVMIIKLIKILKRK